ncbi:glycosyl transferase [Aurantibacter crassamenti]|uniref:glycosyltransferase family protein n=1 Tax=Aurantibacter crassamenti TaxID=1837375 RepID=UPI001939510F|nr:glycosyltransferase family protein [Aurantibacter crassamenti]MBM1107352.1 glycosyl transferase [Aurantibacter crassamenti]
MKVLYAIQGTGNGHLSRARDIIPILQSKQIELDLLVSGTQADVGLPHPIKYNLKGWSFIFGKKGGVDMWRTYLKTNSVRLQKEIKEVPVENYDLVINDFEPVSAWACKLKNIKCISLSHQAAVLARNAPKPKKSDLIGRTILKNYAPTSVQYGLHFKKYDDKMYTPIIRQEIRNITLNTGNHYTVYLPSYSDAKILNMLLNIENVNWQVFSKHTASKYIWHNISVHPIDNEAFIHSMANSTGVLCGAGFESPAEALHMRKKLMVIPMKGQYEQQCNAAALKEMGVPVIKSLKLKHLDKLQSWVDSDTRIEVDYPDETEQIINRVLEESLVGIII